MLVIMSFYLTGVLTNLNFNALKSNPISDCDFSDTQEQLKYSKEQALFTRYKELWGIQV